MMEGYGPNGLARDCRVMIAKLTAEREGERDAEKRKALNGRLRSCRTLLRFAVSRAGYVSEEKGPPCEGGPEAS